MERIDKIFSSAGVFTRTECKKAVKQGRITVNGKVVKSSSEKADEKFDVILLDDKPCDLSKFVYVMLNKPEGVISATEDKSQQTVLDLVPEKYYREGLFPCGRLDKDTLGLVIITNDGDSAHRRLSPKNRTEKEYLFTLADEIEKGDVEDIEKGVTLKDGYVTAPCKVSLSDNKNGKITLTEGKYHEIKRIFASKGNKVVFLKRISFGGIYLDQTLKEGECRLLTQSEIELFTK